MAWTAAEKQQFDSLEKTVTALDQRVLAQDQLIQNVRREHESEIKVLKAEVAILKHFLFAIILAVIGAAIVAAVSYKK